MTLVEVKEYSCTAARERARRLGLGNVQVFEGTLDAYAADTETAMAPVSRDTLHTSIGSMGVHPQKNHESLDTGVSPFVNGSALKSSNSVGAGGGDAACPFCIMFCGLCVTTSPLVCE